MDDLKPPRADDIRWLELAQGSAFTIIDRQMLGEMYAHARREASRPTPVRPSREEVARIIDLTAFDPMTGHVPLQRQAGALTKADAILSLFSAPSPSTCPGDGQETASPTQSEGEP